MHYTYFLKYFSIAASCVNGKREKFWKIAGNKQNFLFYIRSIMLLSPIFGGLGEVFVGGLGWDLSWDPGIQDPRKSWKLTGNFSLDFWSSIPVHKNKFFLIRIISCQFLGIIYFYTKLVIIIIYHQQNFRRNIQHIPQLPTKPKYYPTLACAVIGLSGQNVFVTTSTWVRSDWYDNG